MPDVTGANGETTYGAVIRFVMALIGSGLVGLAYLFLFDGDFGKAAFFMGIAINSYVSYEHGRQRRGR